MPEHKTLNTVIHAAFRRDLARFDTALAQASYGDRSGADRLGPAWDNFTTQLTQHHSDEETIFWPAFRDLGFDPVIAGELEAEHERMVEAMSGAGTAVQGYRAAPGPETAQAARAAVSDLATVLTNHLEHEEHDLEPWAAAQMGTPELQACAKAVRKAHQGSAGTFFAWLSDGAGPDEKAMLKKQIPPPVLWMLTTVGGRDYRKRVASAWS